VRRWGLGLAVCLGGEDIFDVLEDNGGAEKKLYALEVCFTGFPIKDFGNDKKQKRAQVILRPFNIYFIAIIPPNIRAVCGG
jgi:hypothetical protein